MDRDAPCSSRLWVAIIVIVNLLHVVSRGNANNDGLTLFIKRQFANTYLNLPLQNDLFLIKGGRLHNESKKLLRKSKLFGLKRIEMTWFASRYTVNYSLWVSSSNLKVMLKPEISPIPLKGVLLSRKEKVFKISLPCTGTHEGFVAVNLVVNYTKPLERSTNRLQFSFIVHCNQSSQGNSSIKSKGTSNGLNRTVVVSVSAVLACVVVVLVGVVFFWRFVKRIRKKFGFDVVTERFSPLNEVSSHSSSSSASPIPLPTVVYSPKREKSPDTFFTKIVGHKGRKEEQGSTSSGQSQSCPTHSNRSPTNRPTTSFSRPVSRNAKSYNLLSGEDDEDVEQEPSSVALLQNEGTVVENPPSVSPSIALAKESDDKRQMFSTLNEYWSTKLGTSLKSPEDIEVRSEVVGEGAFGLVYKGKLNQHKDVAVKVCRDEIEFEQMVSCVNEAILIKTLEHENLIDLIGIILQPTSPPIILTPLMTHGDLHKFLRHSRGIGIRRQLIGSRQLVNFGTQIASGMEYLAGTKIVHRDLAARNCFVDEDLNVKIGDLALARKVHQFDLHKMEKPGQLAVKWLAIESLLYYIFSEKTDVWSFGILLWELVTLGSQPYAGLDNYEVTPYLETGKRLSRPLRCPDDLFAIMYSCWLPEPEERPSFTILVHKLQDYEQRLKPSCIAFEFDEDTIEMADDCEVY